MSWRVGAVAPDLRGRKLRADEPDTKAGALADILGLEAIDDSVLVGETLVRFLPGGPEGRPELYGERFE